MLEKFYSFIAKTFSEENGVPSSSRLLTFILGISSMFLISKIIIHLLGSNPTPQILEIWLSHLTSIIGSLVAFTVIPYLINRGSGALEEVSKLFSVLHKE